jgi:hypothetical protein
MDTESLEMRRGRRITADKIGERWKLELLK